MKNIHFNFSLSFALVSAVQALLMIFFPVYLEQIGKTNSDIALITGIEGPAIIFGPVLLGLIISRLKDQARILFHLSFFSAVCFLPVVYGYSLLLIISFYFISQLFFRTAVSRFSDLVVRSDARGLVSFSKTRVWGSISYLLLGILVGKIIDATSTKVVPYAILFLLSFVAINFESKYSRVENLDIKKMFIRPSANSFFIILSSMLSWMAHAPIYTYLSLYLIDLGYSNTLTAILWNIGVFSEILFFIVFSRIEKRLSLKMILVISQLMTVVRWLILSEYQNLELLIFAQLLHAFSFAGVYLSIVKMGNVSLSRDGYDNPQTILISFGIGVGVLLGKIFCFILSHYTSNYQLMFFAAGIVSTISLLIAFVVKNNE